MRMRVLASAIPMLLAGIVAGGDLTPGASPCISAGGVTHRIATSDWQNPLHVSFTSDPRAASVRVQIVDRAELADFTVIDDMETANADSCGLNDDMKYVSVTQTHASGEPVIYLSSDDGADYRIFVQSHAFSVKDAAALIVGAARNARTLQAAAL